MSKILTLFDLEKECSCDLLSDGVSCICEFKDCRQLEEIAEVLAESTSEDIRRRLGY